jgi:hypothetical protein
MFYFFACACVFKNIHMFLQFIEVYEVITVCNFSTLQVLRCQ